MKFNNQRVKYIVGLFIFIFIAIQIVFGTALGLSSDLSALTFFMSSFSHGDYIHLFMNSLFLVYLSSLFYKVETFLSVYFFALICSNAFSLIYIYLIDSQVLVVGASGAIFGLFSYSYLRDRRDNEFYLNMVLIGIMPVLMGMNIAWYAHIGGAVAGFIYLRYGKRERIMWKL